MTAIDRETGEVIVPPQTTSFEAEYNEQYMLWAGPLHTTKSLRRSDGVLADFTDLTEQKPIERRKPIVTPFPN